MDTPPGPILQQYHDMEQLHRDFLRKLEELLKDLLTDANINFHAVTTRLKSADSLRDKVSGAPGKYATLDDLTDVCGARIITRFSDDVDAVAAVVKREFVIDEVQSVDKRQELQSNQFGYMSLHYIVRLTPTRLAHAEWKRFADCQAEIQIRSLLQHAWAEIEHDLGYKSELAVPPEMRRRFSILAGILENADTEFVRLRDESQQYASDMQEVTEPATQMTSVDLDSLYAYVKLDPTVRVMDTELANLIHARIRDDRSGLNNILEDLHYVGMTSIPILVENLAAWSNVAIVVGKELALADQRVMSLQDPVFQIGGSLEYLCHAIAASRGSDYILKFLNERNMGPPHARPTLATRIATAFERATAEDEPPNAPTG